MKSIRLILLLESHLYKFIGDFSVKIENFHLLNHFIYDRFSRSYLLVGCVGEEAEKNLQKLDAQQEKQSDLIL